MDVEQSDMFDTQAVESCYKTYRSNGDYTKADYVSDLTSLDAYEEMTRYLIKNPDPFFMDRYLHAALKQDVPKAYYATLYLMAMNCPGELGDEYLDIELKGVGDLQEYTQSQKEQLVGLEDLVDTDIVDAEHRTSFAFDSNHIMTEWWGAYRIWGYSSEPIRISFSDYGDTGPIGAIRDLTDTFMLSTSVKDYVKGRSDRDDELLDKRVPDIVVTEY